MDRLLNLACRSFASNRSQRGLWHGKDIRFGSSYTFSHKATKRTFKPNVHKKKYWSNILKRHLEISVSTKAMKTIKKKGSFDNYILQTDPRDMRSQLGMLLKEYMQNKQADPDWEVPYIPHTRRARVPKRVKDQKAYEAVWIPPEIRHTDLTHLHFDRYDPNAPLRPDYEGDHIKTEDPGLKKLEEKLKVQKVEQGKAKNK